MAGIMFSKRAIAAASLSERQFNQQLWQRGKSYARRFHSSGRQFADDETPGDGNDQTAKINAPEQGPTRRQRAAMVSEEIKMIQRDHPKPSFAEPDPNTLRPPGASETIDPETIGIDSDPGRMGEEAPVTAPKDLAQELGRPTTSEERAEFSPKADMGVLPPPSTQDEGQGLKLLMEHAESLEETADVPTAETHLSEPTRPGLKQGSAGRDTLLYSGRGTSTIAGGNFKGVLMDRYSLIAPRRQSELEHGTYPLYQKMVTLPEKRNKISTNSKGGLRNRMIKGLHPRKGVKPSKGGTDQPLLQLVHQQMTLNATYHSRDARRFVAKVAGMLPTRAAAPRAKEVPTPAEKAST